MDAQTRPAWERLGRLLIEWRARLDPRYTRRKDFAAEVGLNYGLVRDIETAQRDTFTAATIVAIERAYQLAPGSIEEALAGGELTPAVEPGALPGLAAQMHGTVAPAGQEDELRSALLEVAKRLSTDELRAILRERDARLAADAGFDDEWSGPYEAQIWAMDGLSRFARRNAIFALRSALQSEQEEDARPDAVVTQIRKGNAS